MPDAVPVVTIVTAAPTKPWWRSRTLWFNAVCLMLAAAESQLGVVKDVLPGGLYPYLAFGLPLGNAALRAITSSGVTA